MVEVPTCTVVAMTASAAPRPPEEPGRVSRVAPPGCRRQRSWPRTDARSLPTRRGIVGASRTLRDTADHQRPSMSIPFTATQGQYLAFIHAYTTLHRRPPAESDFR